MKLLLISDALQGVGDGTFVLHPVLGEVQRQLSAMRRQWFSCTNNSPLGWYAALVGVPPSALLAERCSGLSARVRQGWVASPFHAVPGRDSVRLLPESEFPWDANDAEWLCGELNPLLAEEGMALHALGAALLLSCEQPIEADPLPFPAIAGGQLPNHHPPGKDGGRLMRLLAEVQMSLHASGQSDAQPTRRGKPAVNGLWLWGACALPHVLPGDLPTVASPDAWLQLLQDSVDAKLAICEAERLQDVSGMEKLPQVVLLAGSGHAVLLRAGLFPNLSRQWLPKSPFGEDRLIAQLRDMIRAA